MDELLLRVEAECRRRSRGADAVQKFRAEVEHKMQKVLGLRTMVEIAEPDSIPRTDFKARRVIDDRAVFRDMHKQIEGAKILSRNVPPLALIDRVQERRARRRGAADLARRSGIAGGARRRSSQIYRLAGKAHVDRHHRRAGQRQVDAGRQARREAPRQRQESRHRRHRSVEPLFGRRDPRRPHPHVRHGQRSRRLYPLDGDARRDRRHGARRARRGRYPRCRGLSTP